MSIREQAIQSLQTRGMVPYVCSCFNCRGITRILEMWTRSDGAMVVLVTVREGGQQSLALFAPIWDNGDGIEELDAGLDIAFLDISDEDNVSGGGRS